jgi:uncharacterized protein (DUF2267 family)
MQNDQKIDAFETTLRASHDWVSDYGAKLGQSHPPLAFSCLRAALHVLRDRLPITEAASLAAQFPMLIRGAFYEGWRPGHKAPRLRTANEVYQEVSRALANGLAAPPADVMRALFSLLDERITSGEVEKVRHILPEPLREMWKHEDGSGTQAEPAAGHPSR